MLSNRQFQKHKFLIVIFAVLAIASCLVILLLYQGSFFSPPITDLPSSTNFQTAPSIQNEQAPPVTQSPVSELVMTAIPLRVEWQPLHPLPDQNRGLITNGSQTELKVALTFDVCQTEGDLAGYDAEIVRILSETQTPATFFLGGLWMRDHQAETLELASNPLFELGNHSWSHLDFSAITPEEMDKEILLTQQQMFDLLGYQTNLFRLPYGTYNETSLNVINKNGLYIIQWDVVSGDPDPSIDAVSMTDWVLLQVNPGSIIIMHANERGWHTAEALPGIIQALRQSGYTFVTVSELLGIE